MKKTDLFKPSPVVHVTRWRGRGYLCSVDALLLVESLRSNSADVIFLDPPFNLGKDYGPAWKLEALAEDDYGSYISKVITECARVLVPGGSLFLYHIPYWATKLVGALHGALEFRHWIAISMKNGFVRGRRLYPAHYALLYFSKGSPKVFERPRISPLRCPRCDEVVKDYGGYRKIIDEKGVNLADVWEDVSPVRHRSRKLRAANQLPRIITDRVVRIAGVKGGILVDPFMGTGTSLVSALEGGMLFVGNDLDPAMKGIVGDRLTTVGSA